MIIHVPVNLTCFFRSKGIVFTQQQKPGKERIKMRSGRSWDELKRRHVYQGKLEESSEDGEKQKEDKRGNERSRSDRET